MKVYNTLSGQKEDFTPLSDEVKMYVCGVTPYDSTHLGHAMSYIFFDTIRRYLEFSGYKVKHVQNFTDIDDKIIARARDRGVPANDLAEEYIAQYFRDMDALNIERAHVYPRATQEVPKIIEIVEGLIRKGRAYPAAGDVYFRVAGDPDYGKLSHRTLEGMMAGARIEPGEHKEHPLDFALWKQAKQGEPQWESPWGPGRPGWHIECSAMSLRYLGESLDIHGGGQDLIFPHHENEIAQTEGFTGVKPFVRYWLHNGLMQLGEDKMSKSSGKFVTLRQALDKYSPDAVRLWVLTSHYRSPIVYSEERLETAEKAAGRLRTAALAKSGGEAWHSDLPSYRQQFVQAMDDDFNTAQAVSVLFDLARDMNKRRDEALDVSDAQAFLRELGAVLGLTFKEKSQAEIPTGRLIELAAKYGAPSATDATAAQLIETLIQKRLDARKARQWQIADDIRSKLAELGVTLEDTPQGTVWKYKK